MDYQVIVLKIHCKVTGLATPDPELLSGKLTVLSNIQLLVKSLDPSLKKHWHIIDSDPALKCFTTSPCIVYKRASNLKNILVKKLIFHH